MIDIREGDALDVLRELEAGSAHSLVTDPPAGIAFMGKAWDGDRGGRAQWIAWLAAILTEARRVLRPGSHALVWALPRTAHWTATALEDAGFEVRDVVVHVFGQGFPKSHDISRAIDKEAGAERRVIGPRRNVDGSVRVWGSSDIYAQDAWTKAQAGKPIMETEPATDAARQWQGWGTALKPAAEHWILARVPLSGTVASNVLEHGCGALNIDACRVSCEGGSPAAGVRQSARERGHGPGRPGEYDEARIVSRVTDARYMQERPGEALGRWPANACFSEDAASELDAQSGRLAGAGNRTHGVSTGPAMFGPKARRRGPALDEGGGASRFFYCPKVSRSEKGEGNTHPTVKSLELMRWLVRLVTPPGGTVLDPFAGSGSTVLACLAEGTFNCVAVERDGDYASTALRRAQAIDPLFHGVPAPGSAEA